MKYLRILTGVACLALANCSGDSSTSPTPVSAPAPPAPTVSMDPELTSSAVKIIRSSTNYHYISWQFTIDSPKKWNNAYVEIKWFDEGGFQVEWSNWLGKLKKGEYTYTDETMCRKDIWATVVRRKVELINWWD